MFSLEKTGERNKSLLIILIVVLAYCIRHLISFRLGMNFEESRDGNVYLLAMNGSLPYRDFQWIYGPFVFFTYPFIMKVFGVNLIVLRISYIIFASLLIPLVYFLARRIIPHFWAGIACFLSIIFIHTPYYTYNHIFLALAGLSCLLMTSRFIETNKQMPNLIFAGIFCSVALLTKPVATGFTLLAAIVLFLLLNGLEFKGLGKRFNDCLVFVISTVFLPLIYFLYFYSQTRLKNIAVSHSYFAKDSSLFTDQTLRVANVFTLFFKRITSLLPMGQIINISSLSVLKKILVSSFDSFIFILPFVASFLIFFILIYQKFEEVSLLKKERKDKERKILLLFAIFSVFISGESIVMTHVYNRAFTIQVPLIITVYLLYYIYTLNRRRRLLVTAFIILFLFYLSFLHFFRYPYSKLKNFTQPLNLERARGILVTRLEKDLYESLYAYLSRSLETKDKVGVVGYYPHLAFLTNQKNIFEKDDYIFSNIQSLLTPPVQTKKIKFVLDSLEERVIFLIEQEKPKILLLVSADYSNNFKISSFRIIDFVRKKYMFDRRIGPAPILGQEESLSWVNLYKMRENR